MQKKKKDNVDWKLLVPAVIIVFFIMALSAIFPETMLKITGIGADFVTHELGLFIQIVAIGCLALCLWFAFGKYGKIRFGGPNAKPEFSFLTFAFMAFSAGIGTGLIYWAIGEPLSYLQNPPFGIEPFSTESTEWAISYGIYHWNIIGWSIYCLPAIPFAYYLHNRKQNDLRLSAVTSEVIGKKHTNSWLGYTINIFAIFGTLGAFSTSMGLSADLLGAGLNAAFGIPNTLFVQILIVLSFVVFYIAIMVIGIKKGISRVADLCVYIAIGMVLYFLFAGNTSFIISYIADSIGIIGNNFLRMSFSTDPINQSGFPQDWTIFYWAWFFAYLVMMGLFLARISKGRTIRQLVLTVIVGSSLGSALFMGILGAYTVDGQLSGIPFAQLAEEEGIAQAIISVISTLPFGSVILIVFLIAAYFLIVTTMISATYSVSMMTSKNMDPSTDPDLGSRLVWSVAIGLISLVSLLMGGSIDAIKSIAIIAAPPMVVLYIILVISMLKWLRQDYKINDILIEHKPKDKK